MSQLEFERRTGFKQARLSAIKRGTTKKIPADLIVLVCETFPDINPRWLLLDKGEPYLTELELAKKEIRRLKREIKELKIQLESTG